MVIYTRNDNYEIWANTKDRKFYIVMADEELFGKVVLSVDDVEDSKGYETAALAIEQAELNLPEEVTITLTKCSTPQTMKCPLCEDCVRNQPSTNKLEDYEQFSPVKSPMKPWKCDGYENKDQKSLL